MKKFFASFSHALHGISTCAHTERNLKVQVFMAVIVTIAGIYFNISCLEWIIVLICIILVLCFEMINSAIEKLADIVNPSLHPKIRAIKDIAAGAVLLAATGSLVIGLLIFIPKIYLRFH